MEKDDEIIHRILKKILKNVEITYIPKNDDVKKDRGSIGNISFRPLDFGSEGLKDVILKAVIAELERKERFEKKLEEFGRKEINSMSLIEKQKRETNENTSN